MSGKFQTPGETHEERKQFWISLITEARSYPGGIQKYCRDHGIGKEIYYHWFKFVKGHVPGWSVPLDTNTKRRIRPRKVKSCQSTPKRTRSEWMTLVKQCKESRQTPSAFARQNNLNKVTFCRWYRRFANEVSEVGNRKRDLAKEAHWRREFAEWQKTGLTGAEYCRQRGIPYYTFKDWQKRIRKLDAEAAAVLRKSLPPAARQRAAASAKLLAEKIKHGCEDSRAIEFAEVQVVEKEPEERNHKLGAQMEIVLPTGTKLRLGADCSLESLSSIIAMLENR